MRNQMVVRVVAAALAALVAPLAARATGGFACTVADPRLALTLEGVVSHGTGGALVDAGGTAEVRLAATPAGLRAQRFTRPDVTQFWLSGSELRLVVYRETEGQPHGSVEITLETRRSKTDETRYAGTYRLRVETMEGAADGVARQLTGSGKVVCSVE